MQPSQSKTSRNTDQPRVGRRKQAFKRHRKTKPKTLNPQTNRRDNQGPPFQISILIETEIQSYGRVKVNQKKHAKKRVNNCEITREERAKGPFFSCRVFRVLSLSRYLNPFPLTLINLTSTFFPHHLYHPFLRIPPLPPGGEVFLFLTLRLYSIRHIRMPTSHQTRCISAPPPFPNATARAWSLAVAGGNVAGQKAQARRAPSPPKNLDFP